MPQQKINLNPKGLYTNVNQLGAVPPGALSETTNVVVSRPGVLGCRRGEDIIHFFATKANNTWSPTVSALRLFNANLRVGGTQSNNYLGTQTPGLIVMLSDGTMMWVHEVEGVLKFEKVEPTYGQSVIAMPPLENDRAYYAFEQNGAFFVNTGGGIVTVTRPIPNTPVISLYTPKTTEQIADWSKAGYSRAGVPWGLNTFAEIYGNGTAIDPDSQVSYRFCFGYRDANNVLHLGAPSARTTLVNIAGGSPQSKDARVSTVIPPGIIPSRHFWQLYRSLASSAETVDPGDDCGLVAEGEIPATINATLMSRTGAAVTVQTPAPHGLISPVPATKQLLRLESNVTTTGSGTFDDFFIDKTSVANQWQVKKRALDGTISNGATFTMASDAARPLPILTFSDITTGKFYFMCSGSSTIQTFVYDGTLSTVITLLNNAKGDLACYDQFTRTIHVYGRPASSTAANFNYQGATALYTTIDASGVQLQNSTVAIYSAEVIAFSGNTINDFCQLGLFRTAGGQLYSCLAQGGLVETKLGFSTNKFASSPGYLYLKSRPDGMDGLYSKSYMSAGSTVLMDKNTGATRFFFGSSINAFNGANAFIKQYADLYQVVDSGTGTPALEWCSSSYENLFVCDTPPRFETIRCNKDSGKVFGHLFIYRVAGGMFPYIESLAWTGTAYDIKATPLTPTSISLPNNTNNKTVTHKTSLCSYTGGSMVSAIRYDSGPGTWVTNLSYLLAGGTYTAIGNITGWGVYETPAGTAGPPTTSAAIVEAGVYAVDSVPSTTQFTFTSKQTTSDFANLAVNVNFNHLEIVHIDTVGPSFIGPYLYTSPAVEGIAQSNYPPPTCRDITLFRTTAFYANTKQTSFNSVTLLKTVATENNNRIYLGTGGSYVTASTTAESVPNGVYRVFTTGTASANAKATIESLARVVNCNWSKYRTLVYPVGVGIAQFANFGISGISPDDPVQFKHTDSTGANVLVGTYTPNNLNSESIQNKNYLYYSKSNIPDAVPLANYLRIGSDAKGILRTIASRDALFVFKEDGCYIVRGYGAPWQVDPYDLTLTLSLRDSLTTLDNAVFGAFTRGVFKVSDSNVELISLPVQDKLEPYLSGSMNAQAQVESFGLGYNADHKYLLWLPTDTEVAGTPNLVYVFDTFTSEWSTWDSESIHSVLFQDKLLIHSTSEKCESSESTDIATGSFPVLTAERKSLNDSDFTDNALHRWPQLASENAGVRLFFIDSYSLLAKTITLRNSDNFVIKKNDLIVPYNQTQTYEDGLAVAADKPAGTTTVYYEGELPSWVNSSAFPVVVFKSIPHGWKFAQTFPETPAATNHFQELAVSFREAYWSSLTASFEVPFEQLDNIQTPQYVEFKGVSHFGPKRRTSKNNFIRTYVPRQAQRGTMIVCGILTGVCGKNVESNGMTVILAQGPTSFQRR
jgi:hypothetical protein